MTNVTKLPPILNKVDRHHNGYKTTNTLLVPSPAFTTKLSVRIDRINNTKPISDNQPLKPFYFSNGNAQHDDTENGNSETTKNSGGPKATVYTSEFVSSNHFTDLSDYEMEEIKNYPKVYYWGKSAIKKQAKEGLANNDGFDDEVGSYMIANKDHLAYRFEVDKLLGKGSFGQVIQAYDHKIQEFVAIKIIRFDRKLEAQADEEVNILRKLQIPIEDNSCGVVKLFSDFWFRRHKCIVFELLGINLYELMKKNKNRGFGLELVAKFAHSMLLTLDLLYRQQIVHADLKPENIMLQRFGRAGLKIIDFGCATYAGTVKYTYIMSRYYRAPEIPLGIPYSMQVDMWSFGCIVAELYIGRPLFQGEDGDDQLVSIIEVLGVPPESVLRQATRRRYYFTSKGEPRYCSREIKSNGEVILGPGRSKTGRLRGPPGRKSLKKGLRDCEDEKFVDFIRRCVDYNPETRMTPPEAMLHPFLKQRDSSEPAPVLRRRRSFATKKLDPLDVASIQKPAIELT